MPTLFSADFRLDEVEIATVIAALHHWNGSRWRRKSLNIFPADFASTSRSTRPVSSN